MALDRYPFVLHRAPVGRQNIRHLKFGATSQFPPASATIALPLAYLEHIDNPNGAGALRGRMIARPCSGEVQRGLACGVAAGYPGHVVRIPVYWQTHFNGLRSVLESAISTPRNRQAGHGAGVGPSPDIPDELISYVLHMTAATVLFLAEAEKRLQ